jgi:ATP-dependent RNA helicase RhlE
VTPEANFEDLKLIEPLLKAIAIKGYSTPTLIQEKSIPGLLEGKDLIGIAQTGTGKTAAFILPILQRMNKTPSKGICTLILAPTRELVAQIGESIATYGQFLDFKHAILLGGIEQLTQVESLEKGANIVVATPGRLLDLLGQKKLTLQDIEYFVLDEADRMLDMGFIDDINTIIEHLPKKRQSLFFSATMSTQVNQLAKTLLSDPIHIEVAASAITVETVNQQLYYVDKSSKQKLLHKLIKKNRVTSAIIFTRTKKRADHITMFLKSYDISCDVIHSDRSQEKRTKAITDFKSGKIKVLVATDIAARGIDINNISHVINYELPNEPETYIHRIGRTARAGSNGTVYTFCCAEEKSYLLKIEEAIKQQIQVINHKYHSDDAQNAQGKAAEPQNNRQNDSKDSKKKKGKFKPIHKNNKKSFAKK